MRLMKQSRTGSTGSFFPDAICVGLLFGVLVCPTTAIIAYDCQNAATHISVIYLNDVALCQDPRFNYVTEPKTIQVIQKNQYEKVYVKHALCSVTVFVHIPTSTRQAEMVASTYTNIRNTENKIFKSNDFIKNKKSVKKV